MPRDVVALFDNAPPQSAKALRFNGATWRPRVKPPHVAGEHVDAIRAALVTFADVNGVGWYYRAYTWCEGIAAKYGRTVAEVAGVLSALSPSCPWERNLVDAEAVIRGDAKHRCVTYRANVEKARRILAGEYPGDVLCRDPYRRRNKTWTFWKLICEPWRRDVVCVDRHALAVAHFDPAAGKVRLTPYRYRCYEAAYIRAARGTGYTPSQVQAMVWEGWRARE